ncbi:hypothetical protein [Alishewanella sp. SMS8]|uniref:hypothetical protein n=1 Tax=Alishewanella sp. SMS8 TaxID=2994676 RepID=UPI002740E0B5|nr:hypothetical protein [Alishewanella sp. SMS8]MDP5459511.1 hypothetical protein [Alishewanella sp. SMS8]
MKLTKTSKSMLAISGVFFAFALWQLDSLSQCSDNLVGCKETQRNWVSWLSGDSRSVQFHFVDFLELLSRMSPSNNNPS